MGGGDGRSCSQSVPRGSGPRLTGTEQACTDPSKQLCMLPAEASHSQGWLQGPPRERTRGLRGAPRFPPVGILNTSRWKPPQ